MNPRSLRRRFILISIASIAVALALAGLAIEAVFERHMARRVDAEIRNYVHDIARRIVLADDGEVHLSSEPADPRFSRPLSGLYWQIEEPASGFRFRSRSLWDHVLALPGDGANRGTFGRAFAEGPGGSRLVMGTRRVAYGTPRGQRSFLIAVAMDAEDIEEAGESFAGDMTIALVALAGVLAVGAAVQVWFGLRPLEAVRRGVNAVRRRTTKRLRGSFPEEITPLVSEVNDLLDAQDLAMERARHRAVDLAHGLKTPLTVIANDADRLRRRGETEIAAELETLVATMRRHIDHELARARSATEAVRNDAEADLTKIVHSVVGTLKRTPRGENLEWRLDLPDVCRLPMSGGDLFEVVGNIAENAAKWARTRICIDVRAGRDGQAAGPMHMRISDDGPGAPVQEIADLGRRGMRLDETTPGTGMGLAIVRDILAAYGGRIVLSNGDGAGFCVDLELPTSARTEDSPVS